MILSRYQECKTLIAELETALSDLEVKCMTLLSTFFYFHPRNLVGPSTTTHRVSFAAIALMIFLHKVSLVASTYRTLLFIRKF